LLLYDYWCPVVGNILLLLLLLLLLAHSLSPGKKGTRKAANLISVHSFVVWSFFPFDPFYKYLLLSLIPSCLFTATEEVSSSSRIYLNIAVKTDLGMCWCYMSFTVWNGVGKPIFLLIPCCIEIIGCLKAKENVSFLADSINRYTTYISNTFLLSYSGVKSCFSILFIVSHIDFFGER
jgi:hypothetical protein